MKWRLKTNWRNKLVTQKVSCKQKTHANHLGISTVVMKSITQPLQLCIFFSYTDDAIMLISVLIKHIHNKVVQTVCVKLERRHCFPERSCSSYCLVSELFCSWQESAATTGSTFDQRSGKTGRTEGKTPSRLCLTRPAEVLTLCLLLSLSRREGKQQRWTLSAVGLLFGDSLCRPAVGHHRSLCLQ